MFCSRVPELLGAPDSLVLQRANVLNMLGVYIEKSLVSAGFCHFPTISNVVLKIMVLIGG